MSGFNLQTANSTNNQFKDQQLPMATSRGSAREHLVYAEQTYSTLFHQPFSRVSTDHNQILTETTCLMNINSSASVQPTQPTLYDINQDHQLRRPQCEPLFDNRPCKNQNNQASQTQQVNVNPAIDTNQNLQLSVPQPTRSSLLQLSTVPESQPLRLDGLSSFNSGHTTPISTVSEQSSQPARGKHKKTTSQSKKQSLTSKESSQTNPSNCKEESFSVNDKKSSKAMVDHFLLPESRLPKAINLPEQLTVEHLYNLDASKLRTLVDKHSTAPGKGVMSEAKKKVLREFHISTEKIHAILCIHLGISQDVASTKIGRWASHRLPRAYDYFKKTDPVKKIYQENGGATNSTAIALVKHLWASYSLEEKRAFLPKEDKDKSDTDNTNISDNSNNNEEVTRKNGFRTSSRNLAFSKAKCNQFVATFIKQANNMSRVHPVQFAIVAILTHLSNHCFQYITTTPRLWAWAKHNLSTSAKHKSTTLRMQAFVTGKSFAGLAEHPKKSKGSTVEVDKSKAHLNHIISTNNQEQIWRCLTKEKAQHINNDLTIHPISLLPIEGFVSKYKFGKCKKRKIETQEKQTLQDVDQGQNNSTIL
ncbi:hypothetical protein DFH28DRAFT_1077852 [Melampsora americana]|nr:hypothetical protein DFH28DRAFT_1077852 [Melampsora americana]